jgi:hypothetical protein
MGRAERPRRGQLAGICSASGERRASSPLRKEEERMRSREEGEEKRSERMTGWTKCWATRENKGRERERRPSVGYFCQVGIRPRTKGWL